MLSTLALAVAASQFDPWMTFSRSPAFDPRTVIVEVGTLKSRDGFEYWFKRTIRTRSSRDVWWTDSQRRPAARGALAAVMRLEMPKISVVGIESDEIIVTADGVGYYLKAEAQYPGDGLSPVEVSSNTDTPLARWVDESLRTLEDCWSKQAPKDSH